MVRAKFLFFMFSDQVTKVKDSAKVIVLIASAASFIRIMTREGLIRKKEKKYKVKSLHPTTIVNIVTTLPGKFKYPTINMLC